MLKGFVIASLINNAITFVVYLALMQFMSPEAAYALTWVLGITIVFFIYPVLVFKQDIKSIGTVNLKVIAVYLVSLAVTLFYVSMVSGMHSLFIAVTSIIINGSLNLALLSLVKKTVK